MTIRTKLTLWYSGMLLASLLLMCGVLYLEMVVEPRAAIQGRRNNEPVSQQITEIVLFYGLPTTGLLLVGGWFLMRRTLTPVVGVTRAAEQIHAGNLRQRIARSGNHDELDRLAEVFNAMMDRLEGSFTRIREFTLHASHELKTPLTILRNSVETQLADEALTAAQRETLAAQLDELERLAKIVDGLTLLAKADAGQVPLIRQPVQLDELVRECHADAQVLALPARVTVQLADCVPATVQGDRHRLRQLLLNLADNAVKYNQRDGRVVLALRPVETGVQLEFANTGPGITPAELGRVFERFFRGQHRDPEAQEGCGLGLSIVHWIVTAHGGTIRAESTGGWTRFIVMLPAGGKNATAA